MAFIITSKTRNTPNYKNTWDNKVNTIWYREPNNFTDDDLSKAISDSEIKSKEYCERMNEYERRHK